MKKFYTDTLHRAREFASMYKKEEVKSVLSQNNISEEPKKEEIKEEKKESNIEDNITSKIKQLEYENDKLKEDNLNYQNLLKITASRGTRPLNYKTLLK
jgi:hypothetical protein